MARPELGEKRRCLSCEAKYYDLNKDPIVCPKCSAVFELVVAEKPKPAPEVKPKDNEKKTKDDSDVGSDPNTISLEDADDDDGETVDGEEIPSDLPEVEVEDDDDDAENDGPFLEDDNEDDDVSDIINVQKDSKADN